MSHPLGNNNTNHKYWSHLVVPDFSINRFVTVPENAGYVLLSDDGVSWSTQSTIGVYSYIGLCWSPDLGILLAPINGYAKGMYSTDGGLTWTSTTITGSADWLCTCWSKERGIFVVMSGTEVAQSYDGINWTSVTAATAVNNYVEWVAVFGRFVSTKWSSVDGITWDQITSGDSQAYGGWDGSFSTSNNTFYQITTNGPSGTKLWSTTDGQSWDAVRVIETTSSINYYNHMAYSPSLDMIAIAGGTSLPQAGHILTSTDEFVTTATFSTGYRLTDITWSEPEGLFVATTQAINWVWKSTDGVSWSTQSITTIANYAQQIVYAN